MPIHKTWELSSICAQFARRAHECSAISEILKSNINLWSIVSLAYDLMDIWDVRHTMPCNALHQVSSRKMSWYDIMTENKYYIFVDYVVNN